MIYENNLYTVYMTKQWLWPETGHIIYTSNYFSCPLEPSSLSEAVALPNTVSTGESSDTRE